MPGEEKRPQIEHRGAALCALRTAGLCVPLGSLCCGNDRNSHEPMPEWSTWCMPVHAMHSNISRVLVGGGNRPRYTLRARPDKQRRKRKRKGRGTMDLECECMRLIPEQNAAKCDGIRWRAPALLSVGLPRRLQAICPAGQLVRQPAAWAWKHNSPPPPGMDPRERDSGLTPANRLRSEQP